MKAVVFDAFGTLVEIGTRTAPYRQLMTWLAQNGRLPHPDDTARIMSTNRSLADIAMQMRPEIPAPLVARLEADLCDELASIRLFSDSLGAIAALRAAGYRVGLCSNLATPYGSAVEALLPDLDGYALSYEVGAVKPDPRIYDHIVTKLGHEPADILFVGDTPEADLFGPQRFGMQAVLLDRRARGLLATLADVIELERPIRER